MAARTSTGRGDRYFTRGTAVLLAAAALFLAACQGGGDLEQRLAAIRARQDEGKAAETLDELTELAAKNADHPELNYRLGLAMVAAGRPTEAVFPLHRAAASEEFAVTAGIVLSSTLAQTYNFAEALRAAEGVLERDPENETALLLRASSAVQLHDGKLALESADKLLAESPDNHNFRFLRASALAEMKRIEDADDAYQALVDADWAEEPHGRIRACLAHARFLIEKVKDPERAFGRLAKCVEKDPEDIELLRAVGGFLEEFDRDDDLIPMLERALAVNPDSPVLRTGLVAQLVHAGRVGEAKELAEKWAADADDPKSWYNVANVRRRLGDVAGALEAVEKALSLGTGNPEEDFRFVRAELLLELGRIDEAAEQASGLTDEVLRNILEARLAQEKGDAKRALELYGKVSIEWPQNYAVRALAARAAYQLGDTARAKSDLLEATRQAGGDTDAALWLARLYFGEGNFRSALEFAQRHIRERGVLDPNAHLLGAEALAAMNRTDAGLAILDDLAKVRDGRFRTIAWASAARLRARTDPAQALRELDRVIEKSNADLGAPAQAPALDALVDLLLRNGRGDDAKKVLARLLATQPESGHLLALRGRLDLVAGRDEAAAVDFERALALEPNESTALSGLALVQRGRGDLPKAIETMRKAAAAAPADPSYAYMAARMLFDQGDRAAARREFEQVLRDHPESAAAANDLAFLLAEDSTDLELAQRHAERAVRLQPSAETLDTLGFVRLRQGAAEEAAALFEQALTRQADYSTARYHLALALIEKGQPVAARQALEEALAKPFPEQQEARKVLAKIDGGEVKP